MLEKNDILTTTITDISADGSGVGRCDGMTVFVPKSAVGDHLKIKILKVKKNCAFAKIDEILTPSKNRITPDCPVFGLCGGCVFRHISYDFELSLKQKRVMETMKRIGKTDAVCNDILYAGAEKYRNKAQFPVGENGVGFYAPRSHRIVEISSCLLEPDEFSSALFVLKKFLKEYNISRYNEETNSGIFRHFFLRKGFLSGEIQAVAVINADALPHANDLALALKSALGDNLKSVVLNVNKQKNNVILGNKNITVWGLPYISDTLSGVRVRLSPNSFYQVNHSAATLLYKKVKEYLVPENKTVLDLFCGTGTIGLSVAKEAKEVIGVEIVDSAVEDAKQNAVRNGIENARFVCGDAAKAVKILRKENILPDAVILDPPRKGCDAELLKTVAVDFSPKKIVYVSCDVATLARDCKILEELGYSVLEYTPVDMFPRTAHVETVVLMSRA